MSKVGQNSEPAVIGRWEQPLPEPGEPIVTPAGKGKATGDRIGDPITTEVVRHGLISAAGQMKSAIVRTAFSQLIHEVLDFGVALYDRDIRLLAQAPTLPLFAGTLSAATEAAVMLAGGEEQLAPGDILVLNWPYLTGSHAQDSCLIMPIFVADELIGYSVAKQHWLDIGAHEPYCADTRDVFQEGTFFPAIKLYDRGALVEDVQRTLEMNSRMPELLAGDLLAQVTGVRAGDEGLRSVVERHGLEVFREAVELMFDHGEILARQRFAAIPDGEYFGHGALDSNGLDDEPIAIDIAVRVKDSTITVDLSDAPPLQRGPVNTPVAATLSAIRQALSLFAGGGEAPHEGIYRPIEVITRPGTMLHAIAPAPCFLYFLNAFHLVDVIFQALFQAIPESVPACAGGDQCGMCYWGRHPVSGEAWGDGPAFPSGQGAHAHGDGLDAVADYLVANMRFTPAEIHETKSSFIVLKDELAPDSCGPGKYRGGVGLHKILESVDDSSYMCPSIERTKNAPWGLAGGLPGRATRAALCLRDGTRIPLNHGRTFVVPKGARIEVESGGGGGYGPPSERDRDAVLEDLRNGYITEEHALQFYPHVFLSERAGCS
jgi:N-methylhydantoinase B